MYKFLLICFYLYVQGCKSSFDKEDLKFIDVYNIGDTLIFKSEMNEIDSFKIVRKEIRFNGLNEGSSGNSQTCFIYYQTIPPGKPKFVSTGTQGTVYSQDKLFLSAVKWHSGAFADMQIDFLDFNSSFSPVKGPTSDSIFGKHYNIWNHCNYCEGVDSTDAVRLIWKEPIGIVWFQRKNKSTSKLISPPILNIR